jgi:predicted outer membrane protein
MAATRSLLIAVLAIGLAPACGGTTEGTVVVDDPVGDTVDEGHTRGDQIAGHAAQELTGDDSLIVIGKTATILAALHDGEIAQASFAVQIVAGDAVFDFANRLIADHHEGNAELDAVVRLYGVGYVPSSAADALASEAAAGLSTLRSTPPADFEFRFVEMQVINHAEAQILLDELAGQVGPGAMGDYIAATRHMIDVHLDESTDLLGTFY